MQADLQPSRVLAVGEGPPERPVGLSIADAHTAVLALSSITGRAISPKVIYSWAHRAKVKRVGTDERGYATYDFEAIMKQARLAGLLDT